jgi:site-specific recombinase XerD
MWARIAPGSSAVSAVPTGVSRANLLLNEHGRAMTRKLDGAARGSVRGAGFRAHCCCGTFAMAMLAPSDPGAQSRSQPLKVVQVLGHASITTTAIYLRCVELHERDLSESLAYLYGELIPADG